MPDTLKSASSTSLLSGVSSPNSSHSLLRNARHCHPAAKFRNTSPYEDMRGRGSPRGLRRSQTTPSGGLEASSSSRAHSSLSTPRGTPSGSAAPGVVAEGDAAFGDLSKAAPLSLIAQLKEENEALRREISAFDRNFHEISTVTPAMSSAASVASAVPEAKARKAELCAQRAQSSVEELLLAAEANKDALKVDVAQIRRNYAALRQCLIKQQPQGKVRRNTTSVQVSERLSALAMHSERRAPVAAPKEKTSGQASPRSFRSAAAAVVASGALQAKRRA